MSLLDTSQIPGYAAAVNAEQVSREISFQKESLPICGVKVRHLNARHYMLLSGCKNRFMFGGIPRPEDIAMFLWFLSPRYSTTPGEREAFIKDEVKALDYEAVCKDIYVYLDRTFQDSPEESGGESKSFTAPVASLVDVLASEYGWAEEEILEMPLARVFQYMRRIQMRLNPRRPQFNRSERFIGRWLASRMNGGTN